jgi:NDMA-dependent alcohol dehydrogenase
MQIRAAVLNAPGERIEVQTLDLAAPQAGEVRVKIAATGVCHSDWHLVTGDTKHPMPAVLGHEGAGTVDAVGPGVERLKLGDHVALSWAPSCGSCFYCAKGRPNLCATYTDAIWAGTMLDGTTRLKRGGAPVYHYCGLACFAEYTVVPSVCCVPIPHQLPFEIAALIGCAVTTGVGSVLNTAKVEAGSSVVVFGAGGVGLSTVMGSRVAGATTVIAVDPLESRREAALDVGATHVFSQNESLASSVKALTEGRGSDYVFEASGLPPVQELCLDVCRPGGTIVFSGLSPMGSATNLPGARIVREETTIKGSYYGTSNPAVDFPLYADLYIKGLLPLDRLISRRFALDEINDAFEEMLSGATRRGVVLF